MRALVREFFSLEAESPSFPWIERVPNAPNPGDGPSRISVEEVMTLLGVDACSVLEHPAELISRLIQSSRSLKRGWKFRPAGMLKPKIWVLPINSQNGQNVLRKLVRSCAIVLNETYLPRTPCEGKALAGKRIAAWVSTFLHYSFTESCRFALLPCPFIWFVFHEVFGEVKRRWQAFSIGLGSLLFPVFWPVIDIITGCLLFGSTCLF